MRHNWEHISSEGKFGDLVNYGRRRCSNCGAEQTKEAEHSWMKVTEFGSRTSRTSRRSFDRPRGRWMLASRERRG